MTLRFLLGVAESGFAVGSLYLLSFFYRRRELGLRCGLFLSAAPLANTFAGALAYGITSGHSKLANWRLLFLVEGLPTLLMAPVAFYFLPDSPSQSRFLDDDEKEGAKMRALRQVGHIERTGSLDWKDVGATLLDLKAWITAVSLASYNSNQTETASIQNQLLTACHSL
jgi:MFS family permease